MLVRYPVCVIVDDNGVEHSLHVEATVTSGPTLDQVAEQECASWQAGAKNSDYAEMYMDGRKWCSINGGRTTFYDEAGEPIPSEF